MSASIHPPVQLHIVLDEDSYQGGDSVEMARRFTAVATTEVCLLYTSSNARSARSARMGESDSDPRQRLYASASPFAAPPV